MDESRRTWESTLEEKEQERLKLKRKEWRIQQEREKKHEERKLKMIEEYERKRAEVINSKLKSLRRSKSASPQRRETSFPDYEHSKDFKQRASVIFNGPKGIIDKKKLHENKVTICNKESSLPTKDQSTSVKIERDIINPDDIILPRRQNEGKCPIFKRNEIKETEEIRIIKFSENEQLEEQQSTSRKNASTCKSPDDDKILHCSHVKSFTHRDNRTDDRHNPDRRRRSPIRDNDEKDRGRNERRNKSSLHHNSRSISSFRDQSRSRYRSRSLSLTNERAREKRVDNYKNRVSSRRNYSDESRELDANCASSFMDYNTYMRLSGPMSMPMPMPMPMPTPMSMPMFRGQAPPVLVPIFPRTFPTSFPPMNIYRWQRPPRFVNSKGIGPNNRYNS